MDTSTGWKMVESGGIDAHGVVSVGYIITTDDTPDDDYLVYLDFGSVDTKMENAPEAIKGKEAVARIIAAAPELLEALENFVYHNQAMTVEEWEQARAAIAKAKGGAA